MSNRVILTRIELYNYRSCKKTVLEVRPNLTTLIGINGSGKSNLLHGILLLKKLSRFAPRRAKDSLPTALCEIKVNFNVGNSEISYKASIGYSTDANNRDEILRTEEKWLFGRETKKNKWQALPMSIIFEEKKKRICIHAQIYNWT